MKATNTDPILIQDLLTRGVEDIIEKDHLRSALLSGRTLRVKLGIDPTSPNIHIGRAVVLRKLAAFQKLGHQVVLIVGDFTAQIGDPSDKLSKRPMLTKDAIKENMRTYEKQLGKIIDMRKAEVHYNSRWLKKLGFAEIGELAESFSVQQMAARRNFKERWDKQEDISLREFLYPLMQGFDSVMINADVELGGFDQLFNVKAGRIIQRHYNKPEQDILTTQMIAGTDGRKMSSSWGNVIAITDASDEMFGKVMSLRDELMHVYFVLCTDIALADIDTLLALNPRDAKLRLAHEIAALYHGVKEASEAKENFIAQFAKKQKPEDISVMHLGADVLPLQEILVRASLASSKSDARRLVEQGGVSVNDIRAKDPHEEISLSEEKLIQVGPRKFLKVKK